jgi:uncharacterized protein (TIRG00374 family)
LAQGIKLSFAQSIALTYAGVAFNNILPGSIGGDFVRCYYVFKTFPGLKSGAVLSTLFDRICGLLGIIVMVCVVALYRLNILSYNNHLYPLLLAFLGTGMVGMLVFCFAILLPERRGLNHWLERKFGHHRWSRSAAPMLEAVRIYRHSKWVILECLAVSIISQLLLLAAILLINTMMGLPTISPFDYMFAFAVAQIISLVPLAPGGIGIGEAAFANIVLILNPGTIGAYATVFFAFRLLMAMACLPGVIVGIFGFNLLSKEKMLSAEDLS